MIQKKILLILFILTLALSFSVISRADEPLPPEELIDWLDYALKRFPPDDCPALENKINKCAGITHLNLKGDLKSGAIQAEFIGYNWSRKDQTVTLLGPSTSFALVNNTLELSEQLDPLNNDAVFIAPFFEKTGDEWKITVPPGKFTLRATLSYDTQPMLPINLANGIGRVNTDKLTGGHIQYDENTGSHGGPVQFVLEGKKEETDQTPQVRGTRVFTWGSIPTFKYIISVSGLQNDATIRFPLLADETIENIIPDKPYKIVKKNTVRYLETTFSPSLSEITIKGHYKTRPSTFILGNDLPFEIWLYVANRRYPLNIQTNANPIDPAEFAAITNTHETQAFFVKPEQKIAFYPITLTVDEGRKGKGNIQYKFFEGTHGYWMEKLLLQAQVANQDRLVIPTPATPLYAGIGGESIELYHDTNNQLSVRLPKEGLHAEPIEVDWVSLKKNNPFIWTFTAKLPGQTIYLEEQNMDVFFKPGQAPLFAWGGTVLKGDLIDQFHLYGFLIGILVFFVCRGLKMSYPLSALITLLFIGLYQVPDFPMTWVLVLLFFTLPFTRLSNDFYTRLHANRIRRLFLVMLWLIVFGVTAYHLANYSRDRIYMALHPYADYDNIYQLDGSTQNNNSTRSEYKSKSYPTAKSLSADNRPYEYEKDDAVGAAAPEVMPQVQNTSVTDQRMIKANEWTAKPVAVKTTVQSGAVVSLVNHNVLPNTETKMHVLVAGPLMRGFWLFLESLIILWMMIVLLQKNKRLFLLNN